MLLMLVAGLALPAGAQEAPDVIIGRADANASGGWPVALWVIDGTRSHVIVRAPREQLGPQRWQPADAQALMHLERFGAPTLKLAQEPNPCTSDLRWSEVIRVAGDDHFPGERDELAHPSCAGRGCGDPAWQVGLPAGADTTLPLAELLPGVAAARPEWLVVYVVSPMQSLTLEGVPQLRVADALRAQRSMQQWREFRLPAAAAANFPAIHATMLEHAATEQGLGRASVLMRSDIVSTVHPPRFIRGWQGSPSQRQALGLAGNAVQSHNVIRLLLRLMPAARPTVLALQAVPWQTAETFDRLQAVQLRMDTPASCRAALAKMNCPAACDSKVASMAEAPTAGSYAEESLKTLPPTQRLPACLRACEAQRNPSDATLSQRFDAMAERQRQAWQWVEAMTGRPASSWP